MPGISSNQKLMSSILLERVLIHLLIFCNICQAGSGIFFTMCTLTINGRVCHDQYQHVIRITSDIFQCIHHSLELFVLFENVLEQDETLEYKLTIHQNETKKVEVLKNFLGEAPRPPFLKCVQVLTFFKVCVIQSYFD